MDGQNEQNEQYGQKEDEYLTPYQTTVVYDAESPLDIFIAFLSDRAQLIRISPADTIDTILAKCDHISPEVLVLSGGFTHDELSPMLTAGFQFIHVFTKVTKVTKVTNCIHTTNQRIVDFGLDDLYDHVSLVDGLLPIHLIEHARAAQTNSSEGVLGQYLITGMRHLERPLGETVLQLCSSARGFDRVTELIASGRTIHQIRERMVNERLNTGIFFEITAPILSTYKDDSENTSTYIVYAVNGSDYLSDIVALAPIHPRITARANFVLCHSFEPHEVDTVVYSGWRVHLIGIGASPPAVRILEHIAPMPPPVGDHGIATTWVASAEASRLLPFIYPQ